MRSKGQVTVYIILGILLLITFGLLIYVQDFDQQDREQEIKSSEELPEEFSRVNSFVSGCLSRVATDAITKMGNRGGIIYAEDEGMIPSLANPTESRAVAFSPRSNLNIPYWFYLGSSNTCIGDCAFYFQGPALRSSESVSTSIEEQLARYVEDNIETCTQDFETLTAQSLDVKKTGEIEARAVVTTDDILFTLFFPLEVSLEGTQAEVNQFTTRIDLQLEPIFSLATELTELEAEYRYLERDLLNLIVIFSGLSSDRLPPMSELQFSFGSSVSWSKQNIKGLIQGILSSYIPMLRVTNTLTYEPFLSPNADSTQEALYNNHMTVPLEGSYENLAVRFSYLDFWPIYFNLNCDGGLCSAESVSSNLLSLMGIQRYNFLYDVSFPVMVEIYDPNALRGQGYYFRFFLEGNIRDNEVLQPGYIPLQSVNPSPSSLLCKENTRNSGDIVVTAIDTSTELPIDDVHIGFSCAQEACNLGMTENGALIENFPVCLGGRTIFTKEGYLGKSVPLDTEVDKIDTVTAQLTPLTTMDVKIETKKLLKQGTTWAIDETPLALNPLEYGLLTMRRLGDRNDQEILIARDFRANETIDPIELAPGVYEIDLRIYSDDPFIIPEYEICQGQWPFRQCSTVPEVAINQTVPIGGLKLNVTIVAGQNATLVIQGIVFGLYDVLPEDRRIELIETANQIERYSKLNVGSVGVRYES